MEKQKFNKIERLAIYEKMYNLLMEDPKKQIFNPNKTFCNCVNYLNFFDYYSFFSIADLPELMKYKPNNNYLLWFKTNDKGILKRIIILNKIIVKMKDELLTTKI